MQQSNYAPSSLTQMACENLGMNPEDHILEHVEILSKTATLKPNGGVKRTYCALLHYFCPKYDKRSTHSAYLTQSQYDHFFGAKPPKDLIMPKGEK